MRTQIAGWKNVAYPMMVLMLPALICMGLYNCAGKATTLRSTLYYSLSMYNQQYDDYVAQAARGDLTEPEKEVLRTKKAVLVELESKNKALKQYVDSGTIPVDTIEADVLRLVAKLLGGE